MIELISLTSEVCPKQGLFGKVKMLAISYLPNEKGFCAKKKKCYMICNKW